QVVMRRLEERRRMHLLTDVNTSMKLIQHGGDGFHVEVRALEDMERPPMKTIPAYWNYSWQATVSRRPSMAWVSDPRRQASIAGRLYHSVQIKLGERHGYRESGGRAAGDAGGWFDRRGG